MKSVFSGILAVMLALAAHEARCGRQLDGAGGESLPVSPRQAAMERESYQLSFGVRERLCSAAECIGIDPCGEDLGFGDVLRAVTPLFGVEWPEGSSASYIKPFTVMVQNTKEQHAKLAEFLREFECSGRRMVELDFCFLEAGREALAAAGWFDVTNRADAATLKARLMARSDVTLLGAPRLQACFGEEAVVKHVREVVYPTDFDVYVERNVSAATNSSPSAIAAVEPQSFTMREVGLIVDVTPFCGDILDILDLKLTIFRVGEPDWKDFGAAVKGDMAYDLRMEVPFFPAENVDVYVSVRPGNTVVIGGMADVRSARADRFSLLFLTPRLLNDNGQIVEPPRIGRNFDMKLRRKFEDEGMEAWTYFYVQTSVGCCLGGGGTAEKPKPVAEKAAEDLLSWQNYFTNCCGVEWPEGSSVRMLAPLNQMWVKNTPENIKKISKFMMGLEGDALRIVELDVKCLSAGREALAEAGWFDATGRVDAATLQSRLMARSDVKLLGAPRILTRSADEAVLKNVVEYIFPTDFEIIMDQDRSSVSNGIYTSGSAGAAVEPQSFSMREAGFMLDVTALVSGDYGDVIDVKFRADVTGEPEWKDYGAGVSAGSAAKMALCDLAMPQPFFPDRASVETNITLKPEATCVLGGGPDTQPGMEGRLILFFVTPRLLDY